MIRINIDILGTSELKRTGMGKFNSDDHYFYYYGQRFLRRNGVVLINKKRVLNAVLGCNDRNNRMILIHFQGKPFNITVIEVCMPQPPMPKKLKLNGSMKIYNIFCNYHHEKKMSFSS